VDDSTEWFGMFERFTETTRRVIFFARYEASEYGSRHIDTEHLLLGLMREDFPLMSSMIGSNISVDKIRQEIEKIIERGQRFSVGIEVPLSTGSRRVLKFAGEEADRFAQRQVGTEHMLLALLREKNARAAAILRQCGAREAEIRLKLAGNASPYREATQLADGTLFYRLPSPPIGSAILTLNSFLVDLKNNTSPELADFFATDSQFIDIFGKVWVGQEKIKKEFERLFAPFAKKNTTYRIEKTISERTEAALASVLWENAVHTDQTARSVLRMTVVLVPEGKEWTLFLAQVVPVIP
jgi:ketosteroid isomerase-like protein